jgi:hypothetical protein
MELRMQMCYISVKENSMHFSKALIVSVSVCFSSCCSKCLSVAPRTYFGGFGRIQSFISLNLIYNFYLKSL